MNHFVKKVSLLCFLVSLDTFLFSDEEMNFPNIYQPEIKELNISQILQQQKLQMPPIRSLLKVSEQTLDVRTYVEEVSENNDEFKASKQLEQSYRARSKQGSLLFTPRLVSSAQKSFKEDPQFIPYFPIYLTNATLVNRTYSVGVEQETPIGFSWKLSSESNLSQVNTTINVVIPQLVNLGITASPSWSVTQGLSFRQTLWKNFFGERTRARASQAKHGALAQAYNEAFKQQHDKANAENVYWQLVIARALTRIRLETLEQAEKLMAFVEQKKQESLVLESDVFQAKSVLNVNKIDYEKARDSETMIAISFNSLRGRSSVNVPETLLPLSEELINLMTPRSKGIRNDLKAQEESVKSQIAENTVNMNDVLPEFNISGGIGYTGNTSHFRSAFGQSFSHPNFASTVMVKLEIPLSPFKLRDVTRSYRNNSRSAKLNLERSKFQHDQQWDELSTRLAENKKMLKLLYENEQMQKAKYENAKLEYERGLTTFFTVTTAHNDYQGAKIAILQTFEASLEILLNLGLYGGN